MKTSEQKIYILTDVDTKVLNSEINCITFQTMQMKEVTYSEACKRLYTFVENGFWKLTKEECLTVTKVYLWSIIKEERTPLDKKVLNEYKRICKK